jgi:hypothetical protein
MRRKMIIPFCAMAVIFAIPAVLWFWWPVEVYHTFTSPSGKHRLVVYRYVVPLMFPGDAPGEVVLQSISGEELNRTSVNMVQNVESPEWEEHSVRVKLLLEWSF